MGLDLFYIFIKDWRNDLNLWKISKNESLKETGPSYDQNFVYSNNLGQNTWNRIEKFDKVGQEKKSLISIKFLKLLLYH